MASLFKSVIYPPRREENSIDVPGRGGRGVLARGKMRGSELRVEILKFLLILHSIDFFFPNLALQINPRL